MANGKQSVDHFRMQVGLPNFVMSAIEWIEKTNAIATRLPLTKQTT